MSNLDVVVSSFWQLARHWKNGEKAKLELACEGGSLHMQLSDVLGHPDHPHFPHPPPHHPSPHQHPPHHSPIPPSSYSISKKKKSPSQLRRQERRQQEALAKAGKASASINIIIEEHNGVDKSTENMSHENEAEKIIIEAEVEKTAEPLSHLFKCDQCEYTNATEKGLSQHKRMKHRISQIDGTDDFTEEEVVKEVDTEELLCKKCNILFITNDHLMMHIESNHKRGPKCDYHSLTNPYLQNPLPHENCKEEPEECALE